MNAQAAHFDEALGSPLVPEAGRVPYSRESRRTSKRESHHDIVLRDPELARRYTEEDRRVTLKNVRILCWIAIILVPSAVVLDYYAYPKLMWDFIAWRLTCCAVLLPVLFVTYTWIGHRFYRSFTILVPMVPAVFISMMIRATGDPSSHYYAGLTLCIVAIGLMFHWTFQESAVALAVTLALYIRACYPALVAGVDGRVYGGFVNNLVFILLNGVVILSGSFYHHRIRIQEFLTRVEVERKGRQLEERNQQLESTLDQLHQTEAQLIQSEKLGSLGRMSAGIIHEINNPLNFAHQALFVLRKKLRQIPDAQVPQVEQIVDDVKEGMERVASIVSDLRGFSHPERGELTEVKLADVVGHALRLASMDIKERGIQIAVDVPADLCVLADGMHVTQVLINLIQNAADATSDLPDARIDIVAQATPQRVELFVRDNGHGISPENLGRVFDPFFTTKDVGQGMGLGLSVSYRMMQQMNGGIEAESEPSEFSQFTLWFPPLSGESATNPEIAS